MDNELIPSLVGDCRPACCWGGGGNWGGELCDSFVIVVFEWEAEVNDW